MRILTRTQVRRLDWGGAVYLAAVVAALLAAWNSGVSLYYLLFGGMTSLFVLSFFLPKSALKKLEVEREAPYAVQRGETFGIVVRIRNLGMVLPAASLRVELADQPYVVAGFCASIPPKRTAQLRLTRAFERRGVYQLADVVVATSFPFGLVSGRRAFADTCEVIVYPRVFSVRTAVVEQAGGVGEMPRVFHGFGDEFFSLREYVPGDDPRRIAWRVSARSRTLLVKELEHQTTKRVVFAFDSCRAVHVEDFDDRFEEAIELIASLAVNLLNRQYSVAVVTSSLTLAEGEGKAQETKLLEMLARLNPSDDVDGNPFSRALTFTDARRVCVLLISADPSEWGMSRGAGRVLDPREVIRA